MSFLVQRVFLECTCGSINHVVRFSLDEDGDVWVDVILNKLPWHKRIVHAIKYVLGRDDRYGGYDETILNPADYDKIRRLLSDSEARLRAHQVTQEVSTQERGG